MSYEGGEPPQGYYGGQPQGQGLYNGDQPVYGAQPAYAGGGLPNYYGGQPAVYGGQVSTGGAPPVVTVVPVEPEQKGCSKGAKIGIGVGICCCILIQGRSTLFALSIGPDSHRCHYHCGSRSLWSVCCQKRRE